MPLLHCTECHHEWEGRQESRCAWCGATSRMLDETTPFERTVKKLFGESDVPKVADD